MNEKEFPNGIYVKRPNPNAPEFVKAKLSIRQDDFRKWADSKGDWINLDLKSSKEGKLYLEVDNWKPQTDEPRDVHAQGYHEEPPIPTINT